MSARYQVRSDKRTFLRGHGWWIRHYANLLSFSGDHPQICRKGRTSDEFPVDESKPWYSISSLSLRNDVSLPQQHRHQRFVESSLRFAYAWHRCIHPFHRGIASCLDRQDFQTCVDLLHLKFSIVYQRSCPIPEKKRTTYQALPRYLARPLLEQLCRC